jgi:hypothetical protein
MMGAVLESVSFFFSFHHHLCLPHLREMAPSKNMDRFKRWLLSLFVQKDKMRDMPDGLCFDNLAG